MQLWSIYAAGNTVPIPFLRATDISPIALLSGNVLGGRQRENSGIVAVEAVQELFTGDGQLKKARRGQNEVSSPSLPPSLNPLPPPHPKHLFLCFVFYCVIWYNCRSPFLQACTRGSLRALRYWIWHKLWLTIKCMTFPPSSYRCCSMFTTKCFIVILEWDQHGKQSVKISSAIASGTLPFWKSHEAENNHAQVPLCLGGTNLTWWHY